MTRPCIPTLNAAGPCSHCGKPMEPAHIRDAVDPPRLLCAACCCGPREALGAEAFETAAQAAEQGRFWE